MQLYGHQQQLDAKIDESHAAGSRFVLAISPTGSGKTVLFSHRAQKFKGQTVAIAHRSELIGQMSYALARFGVRHRVEGPKALVKQINQMHLMKLRKSFYDPNARCAVVSVQTLTSVANEKRFREWGRQIGYWITDEGHHLLRSNMWGKAVEMFPNAWGLGVSAHAGRSDGKGLGADSDGVYTSLVEGPKMRDLIDAGFLVDYKIFIPPSDLNMEGAAIGSSGDWAQKEVSKRVRDSHIMGDVVEHYQRIAPGKLDIVFAPDIQTANDIAEKFKAAGIPAASISSETDVLERAAILGRFERRELLVLVNVDLFGEGYDLPTLECIQFARPTASFQLYLQQFGRVLRTAKGKLFGIVIDHVGNIMRHGLPDAYREETLDRRERGYRGKKDPDAIPTKRCLNPYCMRGYPAIHAACIFCGHKYEPASRKAPEFVDGDLFELDAETLDKMRGQAASQMSLPSIPYGASDIIAASIRKKHWERCMGQQKLCDAIAWWAGWQRFRGFNDSQSYRAFYFRFGVDVLTAQTLPRAEAEVLRAKIEEHINKLQTG